MKWFKHEATAIKDEKIQVLIEKFGGDGYMLYFGLLELCSEKLDETLKPEIEITWVFLRKLFGVNRNKVERFLHLCETMSLLSHTISKECLIVKFPKLLQRIDNWTQDKVRASKLLPSNFPIDKEQEEEVEQEEDIVESPPRPNPEVKVFIDWWYQEFLRRYGQKYVVTAKDATLIKRLLGTHKIEDLKGLGGQFFDSEDDFVTKAGNSIGIFFTQINKLAQGKRVYEIRKGLKNGV